MTKNQETPAYIQSIKYKTEKKKKNPQVWLINLILGVTN